MIENGIQRWASKLCPKIDVEENKNIHLETVKKTIKIDTLRDCIIIGIVYYIGPDLYRSVNFPEAILSLIPRISTGCVIQYLCHMPKKIKTNYRSSSSRNSGRT